MSNPLKIFITGATGHIGGTFLMTLLKHKDVSNFQITALVRSEERGEKLKSLGINVVKGSYTDEDLSVLTNEAAKSDIVFAICDADTLPPTQAILKGLKINFEASGKAPILIHTVETNLGIITDKSGGLASEHYVWSDYDTEKLNALPESVIHRNVDNAILEADKAGYVKTYFIIPSTVFGEPADKTLVDLGIQNTTSGVFKYFITPYLGRKQGGYFGKGLNQWNLISVQETADLYIALFDAIRANPDGPGHGTEGYYFGESNLFFYKDLAAAVSEALVEVGVGISTEPSPFTPEEVETLVHPVIAQMVGSNSHAKGDRSRALGWKPTSTKEDLFATIKKEVKALYVK
ncbi:Oxidase ucsJ [Psilocybe cubensis]|uniref:NmrA-like domain-containing protein n=2 Tax=Psilocybe cubensis TaxID=181762 RepID=A0A8H7XNZ6_PSICU|nr:Oxidase ucsJ [Psilocybe cubensis]KAH9480248.1 Oxidase ucsJ [Psilocybe cubensis]